MDGVDLRERFIQDAEGRIGHQDQVQFRQPRLSPGHLPEPGMVLPGILREEQDKGPEIHLVQSKGVLQGQSVRNHPSLWQVLDFQANFVQVNGVAVDMDLDVVHFETAHQGSEHTGLSGAVAAQQAGHASYPRRHVPAAHDRLLSEADHDAVHDQFVRHRHRAIRISKSNRNPKSMDSVAAIKRFRLRPRLI